MIVCDRGSKQSSFLTISSLFFISCYLVFALLLCSSAEANVISLSDVVSSASKLNPCDGPNSAALLRGDGDPRDGNQSGIGSPCLHPFQMDGYKGIRYIPSDKKTGDGRAKAVHETILDLNVLATPAPAAESASVARQPCPDGSIGDNCDQPMQMNGYQGIKYIPPAKVASTKGKPYSTIQFNVTVIS